MCPTPVPTCPLPPSEGPSPLLQSSPLKGRKQDTLLFHQLPSPDTQDDTQPLRECRSHIEPLCTFSHRNFLDFSSGLCPRPQGSLPNTLFPLPVKNHHPSPPLLLPLQAMGSLSRKHSNQYYGTGFEERKRFIARSTNKDMGGSSSSNLPPQSGIQSSFYELGRTAWYEEFAVRGGL